MRPSTAKSGLVLVIHGLWVLLVVATPLLGAWVASSLAAYCAGPVALSASVGLLLFPLLPLAWEARSSYQRRRKGDQRPRYLTLTDRLTLRTLAINLLFLGALLAAFPERAFAALSTRGDWMLEGHQGPGVERLRRSLFVAADRLEWLYVAVRSNPFEQTDGKVPRPTPKPTATTAAPVAPTLVVAPTASAAPTTTAAPGPVIPPEDRSADDKKPEAKPQPASAEGWPMAATLHPAVASMPADAEQSIAAVARYIAEREQDPKGRAKAAHDWVADRIAYDAPSYAAGRYPPQDAETVFRERKAVCAGYSQLYRALGKALGLDVVYVVGDARTSGSSETGASHAWNAVKLNGRYHLVDTTWDSGSVSGATFTKHYRPDYFLTPPEVFGLDHFPDSSEWQLRLTPLTRGDFFRQAMMSPRFYAEGRELISPTRSQVSVSGDSFLAQLRNPRGLHTLASLSSRDGKAVECKVSGGAQEQISCPLPARGAYVVRLFSNDKAFGTFHYIGQIDVHRD